MTKLALVCFLVAFLLGYTQVPPGIRGVVWMLTIILFGSALFDMARHRKRRRDRPVLLRRRKR